MYKCATNIWLLHNCLFKYIQRKEMERTSKISMTKANVVSHSILDRKKKTQILVWGNGIYYTEYTTEKLENKKIIILHNCIQNALK